MQELKARLCQEGAAFGRGVLKVDSFLNHQVEPELMLRIGQEFARRFASTGATRVLTAEISGIVPAFTTALALQVPLVIARKNRSLETPRHALREATLSARDKRIIELSVSEEFLGAHDRVLLIDDFLSSAQELLALMRLVERAGARTVGAGVVIEKAFEGGRAALEHFSIPVESLVAVERIEGDRVVLRD